MSQSTFASRFTQVRTSSRLVLIGSFCLVLFGTSFSHAQGSSEMFIPCGDRLTYSATTSSAPSTLSAIKPMISSNLLSDKMVELNGKLYGLKSEGGANNLGALVAYDSKTNTYTNLKDFVAVDGASPFGSLTVYNGKLYGMTHAGGAMDEGVLFSYDPATQEYVVRKDFTMSDDQYPYRSLAVHDNKLYGLSSQGGINTRAVLLEFNSVPFIGSYTKK